MDIFDEKHTNLDLNSLKFVPRGPFNIRPGDKSLPESMLVSLLTHIYASLARNNLSNVLYKP